MTAILQGAVLFSDDVREEADGKSSFMGLLGPEVWVTKGSTVRFVCTLLLWACGEEITVSASFALENAPEGVEPPRPFTKRVTKDPDDKADRWEIHVMGRLEFKIGDKPLIFTPTFTVGEQVFTNRIIFDSERSTDSEAAEGRGNGSGANPGADQRGKPAAAARRTGRGRHKRPQAGVGPKDAAAGLSE
jgi:hypothetical protein